MYKKDISAVLFLCRFLVLNYILLRSNVDISGFMRWTGLYMMLLFTYIIPFISGVLLLSFEVFGNICLSSIFWNWSLFIWIIRFSILVPSITICCYENVIVILYNEFSIFFSALFTLEDFFFLTTTLDLDSSIFVHTMCMLKYMLKDIWYRDPKFFATLT